MRTHDQIQQEIDDLLKATQFHCVDRYDGTATSSWRMSPEDFKAFREAESKRRKRK